MSHIESEEAPSRRVYHAHVAALVLYKPVLEKGEKWKSGELLMEKPPVFWRRSR